MSDEKILDLIIEYDSNNLLENIGENVGVRSFFPTQHEIYSIMGSSPQTLSDIQKRIIKLHTLTPIVASYDYSEKIIRYYWENKYEKYELYYP